jgi:hypothetical protein
MLKAAIAERQRREAGKPRQIITGVPRRDRGDDCDYKWTPTKAPYFPPAPAPEPNRAAPQPPAPKVSEWRRVWITIRLPNPERNDLGELREGRYRTEGELLHVQDDRGNSLRRERLQAEDNIDAAARKILRETHSRHGALFARSITQRERFTNNENPRTTFSLRRRMAAEECPLFRKVAAGDAVAIIVRVLIKE